MKNQNLSVETLVKELPVTMLESGLLRCDVCNAIRVLLLKEEEQVQREQIEAFQKNDFQRLLVAKEEEIQSLINAVVILKKVVDYRKRSFKDGKRQDYWFVAKDITGAFGYKNHKKAIDRHVAIGDIKRYPIMDGKGRMQKTLLINLNALHALAKANGTTPAWNFYKAVERCLSKGNEAVPEGKADMRLDLRANIIGCHNIYPYAPWDKRAAKKGCVTAFLCNECGASQEEILKQMPPRCCKPLKALKSENAQLKSEVGVLERVRGLVGSGA